eukprot:CAMPEP_0195309616 /NCGR_PEP_ID=MMETSP0707-20130614/38826_1 /TAXON_ID=33640 /ORGANISM="Asterionellopsis glacialis, Strain CCMP134" /LENGTH=702 /DNA_ID=CAMNT_0040373913 /DNA_START=316 /DNA_END=2424 /DNA_ORIENTATION=-
MAANFASSEYTSAFHDLPLPNTETLRMGALDYLQKYDPKLWYDDPICSLLNGDKLTSTAPLFKTTDFAGKENGHQHLATPEQNEALKEHIRNYKSPYTDIRPELRRIEEKLLTTHVGFLIGNQCVDFGKQDGITEMEESIMANAVERKLNDMVLQDETDGKITISRQPIYVSCVSNFTNFLDLFRKTIRSIELGIPCVVLSRSNTVQHSYRWTELLAQLLKEEAIDPGMLTYMSCTLDDVKDITQTCKDHTGNLYSTCSRALAENMMSGYPKTVASTGGPNTLVTTEWTEDVKDAIRMSATIECAGQCTALRHAVVPSSVTKDEINQLFEHVKDIPDAPTALKESMFDGIFPGHEGSLAPPGGEFMKHGKKDASYKISDDLPPDGIEEYWRKVAVDFTKMSPENDKNVLALASWLNKNQPITLAVNAPRTKTFDLGMSLFEKTGLVVYTVGSTDNDKNPCALTCQARPQEGEVFGEFPPRKHLRVYTRFPVVVPSSTPAYDSVYSTKYLESLSIPEDMGRARDILKDVKDKAIQGYCVELFKYLADATSENPKRGFGTSRTALWGLQRPPIVPGLKTVLRVRRSLDCMAPVYLLFFATNARDQVEVSIPSSNEDLISICEKDGIPVTIESEDQFDLRTTEEHPGKYYNIVRCDLEGPMKEFPMVGQFVSLYFPLGHIKSTMADDEEFVEKFKASKKWLKMNV